MALGKTLMPEVLGLLELPALLKQICQLSL